MTLAGSTLLQKLARTVAGGAGGAGKFDRQRAKSPASSRAQRVPPYMAIDDETSVPLDLFQFLLKEAEQKSNTSGQHALVTRTYGPAPVSNSFTGGAKTEQHRTMHLVSQERLVELQKGSQDRKKPRPLTKMGKENELMPGEQVARKTGFRTDQPGNITVVMPGESGAVDDTGNGFINSEGHCQWVPRSNIARARPR